MDLVSRVYRCAYGIAVVPDVVWAMAEQAVLRGLQERGMTFTSGQMPCLNDNVKKTGKKKPKRK